MDAEAPWIHVCKSLLFSFWIVASATPRYCSNSRGTATLKDKNTLGGVRSLRRLTSTALVFLVALTCLLAQAIPALGEEPTEWELKIPEGVQSIASIDTAPRLNSLEGKTIGLYWNGKPGGDYFFNRLAELLQQRFPTAKIVKFWEVNTAKAFSPVSH